VAGEVIWASDPSRPTTWHGDAASIVRRLVAKLEEAGVPDQLATSRRLLAQAERLGEVARDAKAAAQRRWDAERGQLLTGEVDPERLARTLSETAPWLDVQAEAGRAAPAMAALWQAAQVARSNAVQAAAGEASGLYARLQAAAGEVVAQVAGTPPLPREVWSAPTHAQASTVAIRAGHELGWSVLVKAGTRFESIHEAARMLVDSGGLGAVLFPAGCPEPLGMAYLGWEDALAGLQELRRLPWPLRIRHAVDRRWGPGLHLPADHAAQPAKRRGPMEVLAGFVSR
jgi:hypothetical protein